jgi:hypothetical protein
MMNQGFQAHSCVPGERRRTTGLKPTTVPAAWLIYITGSITMLRKKRSHTYAPESGETTGRLGKRISLVSALLLAGTAVVGTAGSASAMTPPSNRPSQCEEKDYTAHVEETGALICWYADTATAKICDTAADGYWPAMYIEDTNGFGLFVIAGYDPYGSGGCVWYYPPAADFDNGGQIHFQAILTDKNSQVLSQSGTLTEPW